MIPAPTLPSYPLYLLLHPAHAASLRTRASHGLRRSPAPTATDAPAPMVTVVGVAAASIPRATELSLDAPCHGG